jgi:hypothetical protein
MQNFYSLAASLARTGALARSIKNELGAIKALHVSIQLAELIDD